MKLSIITIVALLLLVTAQAIAAEDAPSMWMAQMGDNIDLMVNTSEESSGANAWIHFDPACVNITDVDFTGSPWQPLEPPGWSHQGDYIILVAVNLTEVPDGGVTEVPAGEYKIATLTLDCVGDDCASHINITRAEPIGVEAHNTTYICSDPVVDDALISIGDGSGTVTLPIVITDAENVGAVDVTLNYDPTIVTVTGVSGGDLDCTYTNLEHVSEGWIRVGAVQGDNPGLNGKFTLLNINFSAVSSDASCPLELTVTTFKDSTPNCTAMSYTVVSGTYTSSQNGDANGDDVVDIADAMYIAKHVIGLAGYEKLDEEAADVNGDGTVDMSDSMYLTKHVLELTGFEELK